MLLQKRQEPESPQNLDQIISQEDRKPKELKTDAVEDSQCDKIELDNIKKFEIVFT